MAGIYIHVPFCFTACGYCDFVKTTRLSSIRRYQEALLKEIDFKAANFNYQINTIYVGGGTPSLMNLEFFNNVMNELKKSFNFSPNNEITIEVNPDDITESYLTGLQELGFNRLSIGVQSFNDYDLSKMNRRHNSKQAYKSIELAHQVGFRNVGIDLIYALPWGSVAATKQNLEICHELPIDHLSAYHLVFEPGTRFSRMKEKGKLIEANESRSCEEYELLCKFAYIMKMNHYEVSNFCRPGFESKHNSSYWSGVPYLGLGPGSHSLNGNTRSWNKPGITLYTKGNFALIVEKEMLDEVDIFNELLMLGLRTKEGVRLDDLHTGFSSYYQIIEPRLKKWEDTGHLYFDAGYLKCREMSWMIVDAIINDLFLIK